MLYLVGLHPFKPRVYFQTDRGLIWVDVYHQLHCLVNLSKESLIEINVRLIRVEISEANALQ